MNFERSTAVVGASLALTLATIACARQIAPGSEPQGTGAQVPQSDASDRFDAPTTAPATGHPALPPGHPSLPGAAAAGSQLPAGHPPLPNKLGPVDPRKAAGQTLPAGHPPVNSDSAPTTNPTGTGMKMPPLPPQSATLDIRVVQGTAGAAAITGGTPMLELYEGDKLFASMPTPLEQDGHIHIYDIPIQNPFVPVVKMTYAGVEYEVAGEPIDPQHLAQEVVLTVYEPTTTPTDWLIRMRHLVVQPTEAHVEVSEVIVVENPGDRVFTTTKDAQGKSEPVFKLPLPPGAHDVHVMSGFGASRMTVENGTLVNRVGMAPGQSQYQIAYALPVSDGTLSLPLESQVMQKNVAVLVPDDGTSVDVKGLTPAGTSDMGSGNKVRLYKAADVGAGSELGLAVGGLKQIAEQTAPPGSDPAAHLVETPSTQPSQSAITPGPQRFAILGLVGVVVAGLAFALTRRAPKVSESPEPSNATR